MKRAASLTTAVGTAAYLAIFGTVPASPPEANSLPEVLLNEVHWDPVGPDAGSEWIELAVTGGKDEFDLQGYSLVDGEGQSIYKFGPEKVRLGDTVLVSLGGNRPSLAAKNLTHGGVHLLFSGPTSKEKLANKAESLGLRDPGGTLVDFVTWGDGAPDSGSSLLSEAIDSGQWKPDDFVSTAFDADGPTHPGYTIGRDRHATDLNRAADWAGNGGHEAAGASPGGPNNIDVENVGGLIELAQEAVNAAFLVYGSSPSETLRFAVSSSGFDSIDVENLPGFHWKFTARHTFTIEDTFAGTGPEEWSGVLYHAFDEIGPRAYRVHASGRIQSPSGDSLDVDLTVERSGFGSATISEQQSIELALALGGGVYPFESTNLTTGTLKGPENVETRSVRQETSWGGQADSSEMVVNTQDLSDTARTFSVEVESTPFGRYPHLGGTAATSTDLVRLSGAGDVTLSGPEEVIVRYQSLTVSFNGQLRAQVMPSDPALVTTSRVAGASGDATGVLLVTSHYPMYDAAGSTLLASFGHSERVTVTQASGKAVSDTEVDLLLNGSVWNSGRFFVDPPQTYIPPPDDYEQAPPSYGSNGGNGGGSARDIVRVGGTLVIAFGCILGTAPAAAGSVAAAPATGGASLAGLVAAQKVALGCAAAAVFWAEVW